MNNNNFNPVEGLLLAASALLLLLAFTTGYDNYKSIELDKATLHQPSIQLSKTK